MRAHSLYPVLLAILCLTGSVAWALDPANPPAQNFDLTHWYLGLPVDSSGGTNGDSATISTAQLLAGYTNSLYFYTGPDGAMTFWAPVTGATTSGSSFPRSELRELISPPSTDVNWTGYGLHTLNAQCKVLQVPSTLKVIIGQIHGYTGAALPLVKVQYSNGKIEALIKTNSTNDASDFKFTYANVGLSNTVNYQIKVLNGLVSVAVNGVTNSLNVFQTDPNWATNTLYFKAGDYCQDNLGDTNEGARVAFYSVALGHAPSITNQPASRVVQAGSNTTFTVSALGNAPITYRWRLNGTNISGATKASYTLTNAQTANAGSYSVVVTDLTGVVTSSIAALVVNHAPSPGVHKATTTQDTSLSIPVAAILAGDSDPDGDPLSITAVSALTTNNGSVTLSNNLIAYLPPAGYVGNDRLSYTLADTNGGTATGYIFLTVNPPSSNPLNAFGSPVLSNGNFIVTFAGVAGNSYTIDSATNVAGPWELGFTNLIAGSNGLFILTATNDPPVPERYFRSSHP